MSASGFVILTSLFIFVRKFPLITLELALRMADFGYRQFLDDSLDRDIEELEGCGFQDIGSNRHHCYRLGDLEFYTTAYRVGFGSFVGWHVRMAYLPNVFVEVNFGDVDCFGHRTFASELTQRIEQEILFLQLAKKEAQEHVR